MTPAPAALERLRRLHGAVCQLAEQAPDLIAHPECARALEQTLIEAWRACPSGDHSGEERATLRRHDQIMRRFYRMMEENPDQAVYLPELCRTIGVSDRTLRTCCHEQLGVSPKRYLVLRRLLFAHRALRRRTSGDSTVTEIATQYGFWELGRFAMEYRRLFGETPSATLHRKKDDRRDHAVWSTLLFCRKCIESEQANHEDAAGNNAMHGSAHGGASLSAGPPRR